MCMCVCARSGENKADIALSPYSSFLIAFFAISSPSCLRSLSLSPYPQGEKVIRERCSVCVLLRFCGIVKF